MKRTLAAIIALTLAAPALAVTKSHTSSVKQNVAAQSWTQTCTIKAVGVSALKQYMGLLWIRYNDPNGEQEFFRRNYYIGPGYETFAESSTGLYSINATLSGNTITVKFSATRYGPMYQWTQPSNGRLMEGGTLTCVGNILYDNGATDPRVVHNIFLEEHVGAWQ